MKNLLIFVSLALLIFSCKSQPLNVSSVEVIEPEFDVISIFIIQADIVVTEFEAVIKIDNPNDFAVELSSINYELYGNDLFWASGTTNNIFTVPAKSSGQTSFVFKMNFINMNRRLLDDVIAMRQVKYRFKGQAQVRPVFGNVSSFFVNFDCSGMSDVKRVSDR